MRFLRFIPAILLLQCLHSPVTAGVILDELVRVTNPEQKAGRISELDRATTAFRERDYDRCLEALEQAQKRLPKLPPPRLMLAILFLDAAQPAAGRALLEPIAVEHRTYPLLYEVFGRIALAEGRVSDAELQFGRALELLRRESSLPVFQRAHFEKNCQLGLATVAEARQDWKSAFERLSDVVKTNPTDAGVRQRLGRAAFQLGEEKLAHQQLSLASKDNPKHEAPAVSMALLFAQRGDVAATETWFKRAVDELPDDVHAWLTYGNWLLDQGRVEDATQTARRAEKLNSAAQAVRGLSGLCARHEQRFGDAEAVFQQLHLDEPGEFQWSNQLALSLIEEPEPEKRNRALQLAEVNARQYPHMAEALATLGWIYYRLGRVDDAQRTLNSAISGGKASSDTAFYVARLKSEQKNLTEARALLSTALGTSGLFVHRKEAEALLALIVEKPADGPANATGKATTKPSANVPKVDGKGKGKSSGAGKLP